MDETPPKTMRVMPLILTPYLSARYECASSWANMVPKNTSAATVPNAYFTQSSASSPRKLVGMSAMTISLDGSENK